MADIVDLGPLTMAREGNHYCFTLTPTAQPVLELPPDLEQDLSARLAELLPPGANVSVVFDLQNLPAISSRQLGLMLALRKVLCERSPRLTVSGASDGVRRLLQTTRTDQFFELI